MPWGGTCKKRESDEELRYRSSLGPEGVEGATTIEGAQTVSRDRGGEAGTFNLGWNDMTKRQNIGHTGN